VGEVICDFVHMILVYCGEYWMWFNGCAYVFLLVSARKLLHEKWGGCGRVIVVVMNVLLLVMISLLLFI
jgi:hypothetical protein